MDTVQGVLLLVILILTLLLTVLGIQVFFILRDLRITISKANKVLDNTGVITESVSEPVSFLSSFILGTKAAAKLLKLRKKLDE